MDDDNKAIDEALRFAAENGLPIGNPMLMTGNPNHRVTLAPGLHEKLIRQREEEQRTEPDTRTRQQRRFEKRKGGPRQPDVEAVVTPRAASAAKLMALAGDRPDPTDAAVWGGRLNIYVCDGCRRHIVTRDVTEGVTPFMLPAVKFCPAQCGQDGGRVMMTSGMYRVWNQSMREDYQWYAPDAAEIAAASPGQRAHYEKGGLEIRKAVFEGKAA